MKGDELEKKILYIILKNLILLLLQMKDEIHGFLGDLITLHI